MSDPTLPGWPGTGPLPDPEPEGFRDEQIALEAERLAQEQVDQAQRSKEAKEFYSGRPEVTEPEPPAKSAPPPPSQG